MARMYDLQCTLREWYSSQKARSWPAGIFDTDLITVTARPPIQSLGLLSLPLFLCLCLLTWGLPVSAAHGASLSLNPVEQAWIDAHPSIEVGICGICPPIDFVARDGAHSGIAADYIRIAAERLGVSFQTTHVPKHRETADDLAGRGLKLLVTDTWRSEISPELEYTAAFFTDSQVIVTRLQHGYVFRGLEDLAGKSVSLETDSLLLKQLRVAYPEIELKPVASTVAALRAVSSGEVDAYVGSDAVVRWLIQEHQITNLLVVGEAGLEPLSFRFGVLKDPEWSPLAGLLNKVLGSITEKERLTIRQRWLPIGIETHRSRSRTELSPEQQAWLTKHPLVRLGIDPAWPPIEFIDEAQEYRGITSEYIKLISEELNIRMSPLTGLAWSEVLVKAKKGEIDLLPAVGKTSERASFLNFTEPYLTFPFVIYIRENAPIINGLEDLGGKRVAVEGAYAFRAVLERDFPDLQLVLVENPKAGLQQLSAGKVDAYTGNLAVGSYLISKEKLTNVKVGAPTPYRFDLRMAVRKDWPELIPILQKILDGLSDEDKLAIRQKWLRLYVGPALDTKLLWQIALGVSLMLGVAGLWLLQMRRQRETLRRSEERYHLAMDAVSEAVWEWDLRTGKRYFSPGFFYHLGYAQAEIPGSDGAWLELLHPQDRAYFQTSVKRHIKLGSRDGQPLLLEFRVRNKQGETVDVQSVGKVVECDDQGNAVLCRGTLRDISAQKQVEAELRKLSQAVEHSPVMVIITDVHGNIEYVNPKFTKVTGYTASEVYGKNPRFLQSGLTDNRLYKDLWETLSAGKEWRGEMQDRKKNGQIYWESISISVVKNAEGEITHYVGVKEDISARKEAERLLAVAKEEAEQANRFKSNFLANMSHEVRTPMNAIIGLAHLMLQTDLDARQCHYLKKIKDSAQNLLGIINDILDFSKIEAGRLEIEETEFQLDQVLENLLGLVSMKAQEKGLKLNLRCADKVPNDLIGDPLRIGQVLLNLIQNAIKFTDEGRVDVRVELVAAQSDKVRLAFVVEDTGVGIEPQRIPRLFEAFQQMDNSYSRQHGGTGLGLSICKQLVDLMDGELAVRSVPGEGSRFRFVLELGRQRYGVDSKWLNNANQAADDHVIVYSQLTGKVLLVEDNPTNQLVARELLESFGLQVAIADEGGAALERLNKDAYDLVLMDLQMPGMDGYTATRKIRADVRFRHLPIIAMTAHAMAGDEDSCLAAGMNDYLCKPVNPSRLYGILQKWLAVSGRGHRALYKDMLDEPAIPNSIQDIELHRGLQRIGGNRHLFIKLLNDFYLHHQDCCERISQAIEEGAWHQAHLLAHTLQGVSGNVGCRNLEAAARELDLAIQQQAISEIRLHQAAFCRVAKHTFEILASLLENWDEPLTGLTSTTHASTSGPRNINLDIIQELHDLLRDGDPKVNLLMDSLRDAMDLSDSQVDEWIKRLQHQVADYDYGAALVTLRQLSDLCKTQLKSESHGRAEASYPGG
jgi:polar amino acid transport system substrate-binding protein